MFEKNLGMGYLLDFYGDALDESRREIMSLYYEEDLSLAEIAADRGISRQGVRHVIKKSEEELLRLENALGLAEAHKHRLADTEKLVSLIEGAKKALPDEKSASELLDGAEALAKKLIND